MIEQMFARRWRGFRIIELTGLVVMLALALVVYLGKTSGGDERSRIDRVEREIAREQARVRLLRAEVAYLEQPERLERLAREYLGMEPIGAEHEAPADQLAQLATGQAQP